MDRLILGIGFIVILGIVGVVFLSVSEGQIITKYQALTTIKEIKSGLFDLNYHVLSLSYGRGVFPPKKLYRDLYLIRQQLGEIERKMKDENNINSLDMTTLHYLQNKVAEAELNYLYYARYIKYMNDPKRNNFFVGWYIKKKATDYLAKSEQAPHMKPEWTGLIAKRKINTGEKEVLK